MSILFDKKATEWADHPIRSLFEFLWMAWEIFLMTVFVVPYFFYGYFRDSFWNAVTPNKIYIIELNLDYPHFKYVDIGEESDEETLYHAGLSRLAQFPCYKVFHTFRGTRNWLKENGYRREEFLIETESIPLVGMSRNGQTLSQNYRSFFVLADTHPEHDSIVTVIVDYGDGTWHNLSKQFSDKDSPIGVSNFEEITSVNLSDPDVFRYIEKGQLIYRKKGEQKMKWIKNHFEEDL